MAKDYTDYVCEVWKAGERVFHLEHFRQLKTDPDVSQFEVDGHPFLLNKDRAYRTKWMPWKKTDWKSPFWTLKELFRSKKVGLVLYREPDVWEQKFKDVEHKKPIEFSCKLCKESPFTSKSMRGMKVHLKRAHKAKDVGENVKVIFETTITQVPYFTPLEPYHMSRTRQPSGDVWDPKEPARTKRRLAEVGNPTAAEMLEGEPEQWPPLRETISPRILKAIVDSPQFRRQYKSFKFGNLTPMGNKWWIWIVVGIVVVFVVLYATGNFQMPR